MVSENKESVLPRLPTEASTAGELCCSRVSREKLREARPKDGDGIVGDGIGGGTSCTNGENCACNKSYAAEEKEKKKKKKKKKRKEGGEGQRKKKKDISKESTFLKAEKRREKKRQPPLPILFLSLFFFLSLLFFCMPRGAAVRPEFR